MQAYQISIIALTQFYIYYTAGSEHIFDYLKTRFSYVIYDGLFL